MHWSRLNRYIQASIVALIIAALAVWTARADIAIPRQAELGVLLEQDCGSCHGLTRKGGLGSALLPANISHFTDEALVGIILDGIPGTPMPPWRRFLSAEEAQWMVDNLRRGEIQ